MNYKEVIRKHKKIILLVGLGLLTLLTACTAVLIFKKLNNKNNNNLQNEAPIEVKNPTSEQLPTKKETEEVTLNQKNALKKQVLNIAQDYRNAKGMTIQDVSDEQLENKITSQQNSRPSSSLEELTITTKQMVDEVQLSKALNIAQDYREQKQITVEEVSDQNLRSTIQNQQTPTSALEVLTQTAKQLVDNRLLERTNLRNLALPAAQEYRQQQNITVEEVSDGQLTNAIQTKQTEKPTSILDELIQTTKTLINDKKVEKTLTIAQDYREKQEITPEEVTDQCFKNAIQIELNKEPTTSLEILISSAKKLVNDKNLSKTILMAKEYRNNKGITIEEVKDEKLEEVIQDKQSQNSTALSNELFEPAKNILDHFTVESNDNGKRITKRKQIDQDLIEYINEYDSNGKLIKKFEYNQEGKLNNTFEYFSNEESLQKEIKRVKYKADGITPHYNHTSSWSKGFNAQEKQTHLYKYKSNGEIDWSKSNTATFDERGNQTGYFKYKYDDEGKHVIDYENEEVFTATFDERGNKTGCYYYKYDDEGNHQVNWTHEKVFEAKYDDNNQTLQYLKFKYNDDGQKITDWNHEKTYTAEYNTQGKKTGMFIHKDNGDIDWAHEGTYTAQYDDNGNQIHTFQYKYDDNGQKQIHWDNSGTLKAEYNNGKRAKIFKYKANGNFDVETEYNADGKIIKRLQYKDDNQPHWSHIDTGTIRYDLRGNITGVFKHLDNGEIDWSNEETFTFEFDDNNNKIKQFKYKDNGTVELETEYNENGDIVKQTKFNDNGQIHYEDDRTYTAEYISQGKQTKLLRYSHQNVVDWTRSLTAEYNNNVVVIRKHKSDSTIDWTNADTYTTQYGPNNVKQKTFLHKTNGDFEIEIEYNQQGKIIKKTRYNDDQTVDHTNEQTFSISYDENDNVTQYLRYKEGGVTHWDHSDTLTAEYDPISKKQTALFKYKDNGEKNWTHEKTFTAEYDPRGNTIKYLKYKEGGETHWTHEKTFTAEYDQYGNTIKYNKYDSEGNIDWKHAQTMTRRFNDSHDIIEQFKYTGDNQVDWDNPETYTVEINASNGTRQMIHYNHDGTPRQS